MKDKKLNKIGKEGFTTPAGYFEDFQERLFEKISEEPITPMLDSIKNDGFTVPENYFKTLPAHIVGKLQVKGPKLIHLPIYKKQFVAIASIAAVLLVFLGIQFFDDGDDTNTELAYEEMEDFIDSNLTSLNSYDLAELLDMDVQEITGINTIDYEEGEIIDYLNEEIENYDQLIIMDN